MAKSGIENMLFPGITVFLPISPPHPIHGALNDYNI